MAAAADFYRELVTWGFSVTAEGDRLLVAPRERITDALRQRIREAKPELLQLLAPRPAAASPQGDKIEKGDAPTPRRPVFRVKVAMDEGREPRWTFMIGAADLADAKRTADNVFGACRVLEVKQQ